MNFPRMLYKRAVDGHVVIDGVSLDTLMVFEADYAEALKDDWCEVEDALSPHKEPAPKRGRLTKQ